MAERTFTTEEVNAALELAGRAGYDYQGWGVDDWQMVWLSKNEALHIIALVLGVLPDGWRKFERIDISTQSLYANSGGVGIIKAGNSMFVYAPDWPEAVRTGQAEIASRLLAARVELERIKAEKGGGE